MSEEKPQAEETLVEKWIREQQEWQRTATEYFDSMVKNDEFLVHLGNAMRGSLLAGKPYPGTASAAAPAGDKPESAGGDARIDEMMHLLHRLEGEVADLKLTVAELAAAQPASPDVSQPEPQTESQSELQSQPESPDQPQTNEGVYAGGPEQGPT